MSELLTLGVSHKTAPIALRERLALTPSRLPEFLRELTSSGEVHEAVAISTCNRTEVYLVVGDPVEAETAVLGTLAAHAGIRPTELTGAIYSPRNCDAARHLYRVTSGLESMVIGEAEVQGQVRRAYEDAVAAGTTGPLTNRLFGAALSTGKRVRTETGIGAGRLSVSSVAADCAEEVLGELRGRGVVLVGTGETSELTAQAMADRGVATTFVANRRIDRARALAQRFGGRTVGFDHLPEALGEADIVISATASPHAIIEAEELELVMRAREGRPLLLIDIAVPRDIEPACAALDGVTLYDIDDLQSVVARHRSVRRAEARRAEAVIEEEMERFARWLGSLETLPTIAALRERGAGIVEQVLAENAGRWESVSERDLERIDAVARAIVGRLLHEPTVRLKRASEDARGAHARMQVLRELFGLEEPLAERDEAPAADATNVHPLEPPARRASGGRSRRR